MSKKILFTGYYGFNNFGDDLFGLACVNGLMNSGSDYLPVLLSPPVNNIDAKFLVPGFLSNLYKDKDFIGKFLRIFFMIYGCIKYREVVLSGGSVISSGGSYHMRLVQYYLVRLKICRLSAIGISVGPFDCEKDRKQAKKLINSFRYLCVRDEASVKECESLGIDINVNLFNDLAGCAPLPSNAQISKIDRVMGVSLCRYESVVGGNIEKEKLRNIAIFQGICDFAIKHNFKVKILILNSNELVGDLEISQRLYDYVSGNGISAELVEYFNPVESLDHISACNIFFSVRLHGAISAYLLNIPFVLVEYHQKCKDFLDYIGFDKENRLVGSTADKDAVTNSLEKIFQEKKECSIKPKEYIENSKKIFRNSPWIV